MVEKLVKLGLASALLACLGAGLAHAGASDDVIKARQNCMKNGEAAMMKALGGIAKGDAPYSADAVNAALKLEEVACADWDKFWVAGTEKGEMAETKTNAKPEVFSDAKGFGEAGGVWYAAFTAVQKTTDLAGLQAAVPMLGKACQGCHEKYRVSN